MTQTPAAKTVRSMTGYAQARSEQNGWNLRVSLRSVNHRFLDLRVHMPEGLEALEPQMRQLVRDHIHRGHVDLTLHLEASKSAGLQIDRKLAAGYLRAIEELRQEFNLAPEPQLAALLRLPGVVASPASPPYRRRSSMRRSSSSSERKSPLAWRRPCTGSTKCARKKDALSPAR